MSRPLVYVVAMSRHPLLMDDPTARDVLVVMADKAQDRNGGRIVASVASLAEASDRCSATVRHARDRLIAAGLVRKEGNGDTSKTAGVFYINEEALDCDSQRFTRDQSPRNHKESDASLLPPLCPPIAVALPSDCRGFAAALPPTRARLEQRTENREQEHQSAQARTHEGTTPEQQVEAKPYTLPPHPVADAMLARVNAANALNRAALASRPGPLAPKVEPEPVPEPEPAPEPPAAPKPKSPGEQRLDAAVVELMAHIAPTGQTEATLDKWRARLRSRLKAKGVSAEAIADRSEAVRKAWAYIRANGWHQANKRNTPGHFFGVTLRDDATLDRDGASTPRAHGFGAPTPKPWAMVGANPAPVEPEQVTEPEPLLLDMFEAPAPAPKPVPVAPRPAPERAAPESAARLFTAVLGKGGPRA